MCFYFRIVEEIRSSKLIVVSFVEAVAFTVVWNESEHNVAQLIGVEIRSPEGPLLLKFHYHHGLPKTAEWMIEHQKDQVVGLMDHLHTLSYFL